MTSAGERAGAVLPRTRGGLDTLANRVTAGRFVLACVLFYFLERLCALEPERAAGTAGVAWILFVVAAVTDALDGWLARRRGESSVLGRIADPVVDKVLVCGSFAFLAVAPATKGFVPPWIVVVVLAREFLVTTLRGFVEAKGIPFPADRAGKLKMGVQCFAIGSVLFRPFTPEPFVSPVTWIADAAVVAAVALTLYSAVTYVWKARSCFAGEGPS
ncbi:MAG TPA: CDP-diacylglycerol--glycerol-3-phosphate 3-phosphatidyltransferase [Planctomycetota bacterium]|nr:CDP-diacylglycerol--glycerol-3-phosphate 3-phosphatidyltransferase [Planctomycetota bacterium]